MTTATKEACEAAILSQLATAPIRDSWPWAASQQLSHESIVGALKSLHADAYVHLVDVVQKFYSLSQEAVDMLQTGVSPEMAVYKAVAADSRLTVADLGAAVPGKASKIGMANCLKNKWIKKEGADLVAVADAAPTDDVLVALQGLQEKQGAVDAIDDKTAAALKRRKLISLTTRKSLSVTKGPQYQSTRTKRAADLTKEMLDNGTWESTTFKPYNFQALGEKVGGGYLHPLLKVRAEFRKILMEMGFQEMPTNRWVESSFWNFDALFQPQSHPARDAHDTFFIKDPAECLSVPTEYYERVKTMHEQGGAGSIGYRYDFQKREAYKNLLRTHTTAVSSQMLYKLAQQTTFTPVRYFSVDRVFRNETMDATHLCEFHQVEGLVADYNLSLGDLIGTIETFFRKIGITQLRFKPAFNPYTEPSMEIFGYHPDLKKWTEIGNSGMFRPEMLSPMGLPPNVRVIAWGLSLERPTMIKYRIKNIRDLFGHKVELARTRAAPVCWFDEK